MSAHKIILMILFIIPFLFVTGMIASSVEYLIPLTSGDNHIWMRRVSDCGKNLEKNSKKIVYMELDIMQKIITGLYESRYIENNASLAGVKLSSRRDA